MEYQELVPPPPLDELVHSRALRRVLRFRRAFRPLDRTSQGDWTGVALAAGYFDQAHLIRDFRRFAGAPPSAFFHADPELSRAFLAGQA